MTTIRRSTSQTEPERVGRDGGTASGWEHWEPGSGKREQEFGQGNRRVRQVRLRRQRESRFSWQVFQVWRGWTPQAGLDQGWRHRGRHPDLGCVDVLRRVCVGHRQCGRGWRLAGAEASEESVSNVVSAWHVKDNVRGVPRAQGTELSSHAHPRTVAGFGHFRKRKLPKAKTAHGTRGGRREVHTGGPARVLRGRCASCEGWTWHLAGCE